MNKLLIKKDSETYNMVKRGFERMIPFMGIYAIIIIALAITAVTTQLIGNTVIFNLIVKFAGYIVIVFIVHLNCSVLGVHLIKTIRK